MPIRYNEASNDSNEKRREEARYEEAFISVAGWKLYHCIHLMYQSTGNRKMEERENET